MPNGPFPTLTVEAEALGAAMSMTEIVLLPLFVTYALAPEGSIRTSIGRTPTLTVAMTGFWDEPTRPVSITDTELLPLLTTSTRVPAGLRAIPFGNEPTGTVAISDLD